MGNDVNKLKQRLEIRKYLVFAGMFLLFLGAMWLIFAPSEEEKRKEEKNAGFNTELPDPRGAGIEGDKIAAYEQADMKRKQTEKLRTLEDFSEMADGNSGTVVELSPDADAKDGSSREGDRRNEACSSSVSAYNDNCAIAVVRQYFGKTFYRTETFGLYIVIVDTFTVHVLLDFFPSFLYLSGTCFGIVNYSPFSRFYTHNRFSILTVLTNNRIFIFHRLFVND